MTDQRNAYGFPILFRVERARRYAEAAKERNRAPCACQECRLKELAPTVVPMINNWPLQKMQT